MADSTIQKPSLSAVDIDYSRSKVAVVAFTEILAAVGFGIAMRIALVNSTLPYAALAFGAGILFLALFFLSIFFIKSSSIALSVVVGQAVAVVLPFYADFSVPFLEILFIGSVFLILASNSGRRDLSESLKIRFWRIGKIVLPRAILGVSILASGLYYIHATSALGSDFPISEPTFARFIRLVEPPVRGFFPDFDSTLTIRDFFTKMAEREIEAHEEFNSIPQDARQRIIRESVGQFEERLEVFTGIAPDPGAEISQALYDILRVKVASFTHNGQNTAVLIFAGFFVALILGFTWPIRLVTELVAFFLYQFLIVFGFANIELEGRSREIIVIR